MRSKWKGHTPWWSSVSPEWMLKLKKMMPNYQEELYGILERKRSAVIMRGEGGTVKMRNTAHMKKLENLPEDLTITWRMTLVIWKTSTCLKWRHLFQATDQKWINHLTPSLQYHAELNAFRNNQNHSVTMSCIFIVEGNGCSVLTNGCVSLNMLSCVFLNICWGFGVIGNWSERSRQVKWWTKPCVVDDLIHWRRSRNKWLYTV